MSSKAELNKANQYWEGQAKLWMVRCQEQLGKNRKLQMRLARVRNGFFRRLRLRAKAILKG